MALKKEIRQSDGVITNYHRILFITITPNRQNSIAVLSYVDSAARADEKDSIIASPYQISTTYETAYNANMNIAAAYEYLKTLPAFNGAIDV